MAYFASDVRRERAPPRPALKSTVANIFMVLQCVCCSVSLCVLQCGLQCELQCELQSVLECIIACVASDVRRDHAPPRPAP